MSVLGNPCFCLYIKDIEGVEKTIGVRLWVVKCPFMGESDAKGVPLWVVKCPFMGVKVSVYGENWIARS